MKLSQALALSSLLALGSLLLVGCGEAPPSADVQEMTPEVQEDYEAALRKAQTGK